MPSLLLGALLVALSAANKKQAYFYLLGASVGLWLSIVVPLPQILADGVASIMSILLILSILAIVLSGYLSHKETPVTIPAQRTLKQINNQLRRLSVALYLCIGLILGASSYITIPSPLQEPFPSLLTILLQLSYALLLGMIVSLFLFIFWCTHKTLLEPRQEQASPSLFRISAVSSLWVIILWAIVGLQLYMF